jgi:hypothetical protein
MNRLWDRLAIIIGGAFILAGLLVNEWVIRAISGGEVQIAETEKRILLVLFQVMALGLGYLMIRYRKQALQNLFLVVFSIFLTLGALEIILRFVPHDLEAEAPVWIPFEYKEKNALINKSHAERARENPYGFNDRVHKPEKPPGKFRLAVLGDSFVWGVGIPRESIWTVKLERLLNEQGFAVEVLNWGRQGWSTLDQYRFLKTHGKKYEIDLLVVGYVVNDPDMEKSLHIKRFIYDGGALDRYLIQPLGRFLFPNNTSLLVDLTNALFDRFWGYGYTNWINLIYAQENLKAYQDLLIDLASYCRKRNLPLLVVMTPENHHPWLKERFAQVKPLLARAGITYLDLYPMVSEELGQYPNRKLWANPADGHPGDLVTELYARHVSRFLAENSYLPPRTLPGASN